MADYFWKNGAINTSDGIKIKNHEEFFASYSQPSFTKVVCSKSGVLSFESIQYSDEELAFFARSKRDVLLKIVDAVSPVRLLAMTSEQSDAVTEFRKSLLDVPQQEGFPRSIIWPEIPAFLK